MTTPGFDPADPNQMPKVLANLINPSAKTPTASAGPVAPLPTPGSDPNKPGDKPAHADPKNTDPATKKDDAPATPGTEKNPDGTPKDPANKHDSTDQDQLNPEDQTYTTTEPGFPIGQLIAGLVGAGTAAGTAAVSTLAGLPPAALSIAMPLMQTMLTALGKPNAQAALPSGPATKTLPDANPPTGFSGPAADQLRRNSDEHKKDENTFDDKDTQTDQAVKDAHDVNAQAISIAHREIERVQAAAAIVPATGEQAFISTTREAVANVRNALAQAMNSHQQNAARITSI
ncbi:hypothetical protein [Mycobacteroides abscessus]|nr:hypothetical protein [Mycobacteroides abscessus]